MKVREHRGSLAESLATTQEIEPTKEALQKVISAAWPGGVVLHSLTYLGVDTRRSRDIATRMAR